MKKIEAEDIELLLDMSRMREASKKFGSDYDEAFECASNMALKAIREHSRLKRQNKMLNRVITEQEKDFTRLDDFIHKELEKFKGNKEVEAAYKRCLKKLRGNEYDV